MLEPFVLLISIGGLNKIESLQIVSQTSGYSNNIVYSGIQKLILSFQ